jgi:lactoylglutathione lyase
MSQVCAISVYVKDLKESTSFYSEVLGLAVKHEMPYLVVMENNGVDLVLCQAEEVTEVDYPNVSAVVLGFPTPSLSESIGKFEAQGVRLIHREPQEFPGGHFVAFRDPSGNVLELLEFSKQESGD